ncbi:MAG: hypothetical protein QXG10_00540 [Candidatus Hadarchaeales archaeon]
MISIEGVLAPVAVLSAAVIVYHLRGRRIDGGVSLLVVGAMFLLIRLGFQLLAEFIQEIGESSIAEQIGAAGIYIGCLVGGTCILIGSLLISLKLLLQR